MGRFPIVRSRWGDCSRVSLGPLFETFAGTTSPSPALLVSGWLDPFASIDQFAQPRLRGDGDETVRDEHRLVIGPWVHSNHLASAQGEINFGLGATGRTALAPIYHAFFDRHLTDRGGNEPPPVRDFLMRADEWRDSAEWPPREAFPQQWYLASAERANTSDGDGTLQMDPPVGDACDRFRYDPMHPVRAQGGRVVPIGGSVAGPLNQAYIEARDDVLCYTSAPFERTVDVVGPVTVRLFASTGARDTDFVAKLVDVFPAGRSIPVCDGMRRGRFRCGSETEVLLEPGTIEEYEITLGTPHGG